jgi:hypothetical protein
MEFVWGSEAFIQRAVKYVESKKSPDETKEEEKETSTASKVQEEAIAQPKPATIQEESSFKDDNDESSENKNANKNNVNKSLKQIDASPQQVPPDLVEREQQLIHKTAGSTSHNSTSTNVTPPPSGDIALVVKKNEMMIETFNVNEMIKEIRKEFDKEVQPLAMKEESDDDLYKRIPPLL